LPCARVFSRKRQSIVVTCGVTDGPGRQGSGRQGSIAGRQGSQGLGEAWGKALAGGRQGSGYAAGASKRQTQYDKPPTLAEKIRNFFDPRNQDGTGDKPNMPIPKWRNGPRGQGSNDGGGTGNVYGNDDRYGKKPKLREW